MSKREEISEKDDKPIDLDQINSDTLFGDKKKESAAETKKKNVLAVKNSSPAGEKKAVADESVCEVRFCTSGRLSAPPILHFYDYNMVSAQLISELPSNEDHLPTIIQILNSMVVEDFDCGQLHIEEIKEVLLNVHAKWWGPALQDFAYFLDDKIEDPDKLIARENIGLADIPIANLTIVPLGEGITEPINIKSNGVTVSFCYPRAVNSGVVEELIKEKFAEEEQKFFKTKQLVDAKKLDEVSVAELKAYKNYLADRARWKLLYTRALTLCAVDGVELKTINDRVKALIENKKISVSHWAKYNNFLSGKGAFGLRDEAEFYSDVLNQKVKRGFQFRTYTLIPQVDGERYEQDEVSFG